MPSHWGSTALTAGVPLGSFGLPFAAQAPLHVGERVAVGRQDFPEQGDVGDCQPQRVDLAEPFLVRERWHVTAELVERRVDAAKYQRFVIDNKQKQEKKNRLNEVDRLVSGFWFRNSSDIDV